MLEKIKKNKKAMVLLIISIFICLVLAAGFTYAFLADNIMASGKTTVDADMEHLYVLKFIPGEPLNMKVDSETLPQDGSDYVKVSKPKVQLEDPTLGNAYDYYVYLLIPENYFIYTSEQTPEIVLKIMKGDTEIKTDVSGLTYNEDIGGFDITTKSGKIAIGGKQTITSNGTDLTEEEWTFSITYKNLPTDQSANLNKYLDLKVVMQEDEELDLAKVCTDESAASCLMYATDNQTLFYHDENLEGGAQDYSYRFAGADKDVKNFVCLDGGATAEGPCGEDDSDLYRIIGLFKNDVGQYEMKLIKYDYTTSDQLGITGAYKAVYGEETENYKGNQDNLANIGSYHWTSSSNNVNEWSESDLRKINLNDYYLNTYLKGQKKIDTDKLITTHTWILNGHSTIVATPKEMYDNEMDKVEGSPSVPTQTKEGQDKIGLMYASDYGYAADPSSISNWSINLSSTTYSTSNWMYMGLCDWTISRNLSNTYDALSVYYTGNMTSYNVLNSAYAVRPSFYIASSAKIKSGDGSKDSPYRIAV